MAIYAPSGYHNPAEGGNWPTQPPPVAIGTQRPRGGATLVAALAVLLIAGAAVAYAAVSLGWQQAAAHHTVVTVPPPGPVYSPEEVQAAKAKACAVWNTGSLAVGAASRDVAATPKDWNDPVTQRAVAAEARTALVESALMRASMEPATPPDVRALINEYIDGGFAVEDAELHQQGKRVDALVAAQNASGLVTRIEGVCGLK